ncbi:MAG: FAD/NAD(P)-binding protein [Pseudomonadota bacterium]|nr:FAD/NAD(P)-binding protein [Pseudomonadota bacterium]
MSSPALPLAAEVVERVAEAADMATLRLRLCDPERHARYRFAPGQFNMLYVYGLGEVAISVSSDPEQRDTIDHTVRAVGRVTRVLANLEPGRRLGLRGPYGRGWPLDRAEGRDLVLLTGGLGCAPVVSVIDYVLRRRHRFRRLVIIQGVKHSADLIWRHRYRAWAALPDTQVLLAADVAGGGWPWRVGRAGALLDEARFDAGHCAVMMCGPEAMMIDGARRLVRRGVPEDSIWLSMERNMQCGTGHCGHCQFGPWFVCRDGPVFSYGQIKWLLGVRGY